MLLPTRISQKVLSNQSAELPHQSLTHPTTKKQPIESIQVEQAAPASWEIEETYSLSPMQQGMLFHSLYQPRSGIDIEQMVCRLPEAIGAQTFLKALNFVIQRHPILRTSFLWDSPNEPIQVVHEWVRLPLEQQDWRSDSPQQQADRLTAYLKRDRQRGLDLTQSLTCEPLMRFALFRVGDADYQFVWTFHHILLDGRSFPIVLQEVFAVYAAFCTGDELSLESPRPYRDYIEWVRQQDFLASKSFWQHLLKGFTTPTPLLSAQASSQVQTEVGHNEAAIRLSGELTIALKSLVKEFDVTLNTIVQGAWGLLLSRYSGETDVVFGATRACRKSTVAGAESMIGLLINSLPIRVQVDPDTTLVLWLKELRSQHVAVRPHEHTPLVQVQSWSDIPRGVSLFESIVMFEAYDLNERLQQQGGSWQNREIRLLEQPSFPLVLIACLGSELSLKISYDRTRFDHAAITRMLGHLQTMLEGMVANPSQRLAALPLLTVSERHQLLSDWNDTAADYAQDTCLHELFEVNAKQNPDAIAIVYGTHSLTYGELNQQANQLAHHLKRLGVGAGTFVGVYMNRGLEMIPALLGILKAGGAYIPLEPTFPNARVQWILESLSVRCVISQPIHRSTFEKLQPQLPNLEHLICLDVRAIAEPISPAARFTPLHVWQPSDLGQLPTDNLPRQNSPDDTAYIIFTSGSTGTPKGVVVRHKPVINLIEWVNRTFQVNARDRVLFITSLCFDLSVYDVFGLLAAGGSIRVVSSEDVRDPQAMLTILQTEPITFWDSAPPALQQLAPFFSTIKAQKSALRLVFMSGDWVPVTLPDALKETFPGVEVVSLGGATEATVWSNFYRIGDVASHWASIPYGKPIQNAQYYVLDAEFNPCPIGVTGELYIGGDCLALGYTDPIKTAERFIANPLNLSSRLYRTGDLARFFPDGNIEFLGRIDHQVKIRGFRIELGEIEVVLSQHPAIADSVVMAREDQPGDKRLVAYVVIDSAETPTSHDLRNFLRGMLPDYMVPSAIVVLDVIPLTQNGKVDRRALPAPEANRTDATSTFVAPQNSVQRQLAEIWQQTLGVPEIGITDNFFELGGHSILAVNLVTQIEKTLGQRLAIAAIFQAPTIQQQAMLLQQPEKAISGSAIAPIQPNGSKRPLFAIHVLGRGLDFYRPLSKHLGSDQPLYGLAVLSDQPDAPLNDVKALAAHYIQQMQMVQPQGPYHLTGVSFGGTIAFEMAQQLQAQGQDVALLSMLDTFAPSVMVKKLLLRSRFIAYSQQLLQMTLTQMLEKVKEEWLEQTLRCSVTKGVYQWVYRTLDRPFPQPLEDILYAQKNLKASSVYTPQVYSGRIVFFHAKDQNFSIGVDGDPRSGWRAVATGGVEIHEIPGNHMGMLQEPNVRLLAEKLKLHLD